MVYIPTKKMLNVTQIRNIVMTKHDIKRFHDIISEG